MRMMKLVGLNQNSKGMSIKQKRWALVPRTCRMSGPSSQSVSSWRVGNETQKSTLHTNRTEMLFDTWELDASQLYIQIGQRCYLIRGHSMPRSFAFLTKTGNTLQQPCNHLLAAPNCASATHGPCAPGFQHGGSFGNFLLYNTNS